MKIFRIIRRHKEVGNEQIFYTDQITKWCEKYLPSDKFRRGMDSASEKNRWYSPRDGEYDYKKDIVEVTDQAYRDNKMGFELEEYDDFEIEIKDGQLKSMTKKEDVIQAERLFTRDPSNLTPKEICKMFEVDSKFWEMVEFTVSSWDVTSTRVMKTATNYSAKAKFKKRTSIINYEELVENFIKDVENYIPKELEQIEYNNSSENLLEINIADLHIGKLAWSGETGETYNMKIAEERFKKVIVELVEMNLSDGFDRIAYITGNDRIHIDSSSNATTKGTKQDVDGVWQQIFLKACELEVWAINYLKQYAPVEVVYVQSNHDYHTGFYLMTYLSAWFKNCHDVKIPIVATPRKYIEWGKTLIGYTHMDKERKRIGSVMQIEMSEAWGRTKFRYMQGGHLHSEHLKEENGVIVRHVSSVCSSDSWHVGAGYIGAIKKAQSFLYSKTKGMIRQCNSVITK